MGQHKAKNRMEERPGRVKSSRKTVGQQMKHPEVGEKY